ncbi:MAG: DUF1045 domain-containing protein [Bosea sp. (in: a-proteobacteria)]
MSGHVAHVQEPADARYALYLAPPPDTALWRFGSTVLGYDAASGEAIEGFAPDGIDPLVWRRMVMRPRLYGFHATLKAPFRLAPGFDRAGLMAALSDFAKDQQAFDLGPIAVSCIESGGGHGFVALTELSPSPELSALEMATVSEFDPFRASLTADERARRQPERLTPRQRASLDSYGYPYIGPDYRFHMTLSGEIAGAADIADKLADAFANLLGPARLAVDAIVLFEQIAPAMPFRIIQRAQMRR